MYVMYVKSLHRFMESINLLAISKQGRLKLGEISVHLLALTYRI